MCFHPIFCCSCTKSLMEFSSIVYYLFWNQDDRLLINRFPRIGFVGYFLQNVWRLFINVCYHVLFCSHHSKWMLSPVSYLQQQHFTSYPALFFDTNVPTGSHWCRNVTRNLFTCRFLLKHFLCIVQEIDWNVALSHSFLRQRYRIVGFW